MAGRVGRHARVERAKLRKRVCDLYSSGMTFQEVADALGMGSKATAYKLWKEALEETRRETSDVLEDWKHRHRMALINLQRRLTPLVLTPTGAPPDLKATDKLLKVLAQLADLDGLNAPHRQEISGPGGDPIEVTDARSRLAAQLAKVAAAEQAPEADQQPE